MSLICDVDRRDILEELGGDKLADLCEFEHAVVEVDGGAVEKEARSFVEDLLVDEENIWSLLLGWCEQTAGDCVVVGPWSRAGAGCEKALIILVEEVVEGPGVGVGEVVDHQAQLRGQVEEGELAAKLSHLEAGDTQGAGHQVVGREAIL